MSAPCRWKKFQSLADHAWLSRVYRKLSQAEIEIARAFIAQSTHMDRDDFVHAINRMFIDKPKPKHWTEILELLTCSKDGV